MTIRSLLLALFFAIPSGATTLELEDQINPQLIVDVFADDGFTTSTDHLRLTPLLGGFVDVSVQGILDPAMTVFSIGIDVSETVADLSFGSAQIPALLTISAYYEWEPNRSVLIGDVGAQTPTGELVDFIMEGSLEVLGDTIPFSFSLVDYSGATSLREGTSASPFFIAPDPDTFLLGKPGTGSVFVEGDFSAPLGEVGGIQFSISSALLAFESVKYAPEPSAALSTLAGIGMLYALSKLRGVSLVH